MAYKFQSGEAILSGALLQEGNVEVESGFSFKMHESTILDTSRNLANVGTISGSGAIQGASVSVDGVVTAGGFTIGSAVINEAELEQIDGITAGTAAASKAVVLDASKDIAGINDMTLAGDVILPQSSNLYLAGDGGAAKIVSTGGNAVSIFGAKVVTNGSSIEPDSDGGTDLGSASKQFADLYLSSELKMGNAVITEAELEMLDGITAGTVAASKAVVVDANKDADGFRNVSGSGLFEADQFAAGRSITAGSTITAGSSFIIGSADLNEADMEKLDGITNGAAAASKAVVLDASKDISGLNDVSAAGLTLSDLTSGRLPLVSTSGLLADDEQFTYATNRAQMDGYVALAVSSSASGSFYAMDGGLGIYDESDETILSVSKDGGFTLGDAMVEMNVQTGLVDIKGDLGLLHDGVYVGFGADEDVKLTHVADTGLLLNSSMQLQFGDSGTYIHQSADGVLDLVSDTEIEINATTIDVNGALDVSGNSTLGGTLTAANLGTSTVDLTADLMIINDGAGGVIKNTSLAQYATALAAGANEGLSSTAGRLGVDLNDLSAAAIASGDSFAFIDADGSNATKKESVDDLATLFAGTGLAAASAVLSLDLNELSAGAIASGDSLAFVDSNDSNASKKETVDDLATLFAGNGLSAASAVLAVDLNELSAATIDVANDSFAIVDASDNGSKKESIADFISAIAGSGITATSGVLSTDSSAVAAKADGDTLVEGYNYFADLSADAAVTLPAAPTVGDVVHVKAGALAADCEITIAKAGSQVIDNDLTAIYLESSFGAVSLVYVANNEWRII